MIKQFLLLCICLISFIAYPQSKKVLEARINELSAKIETVNVELRLLSEQNKNLTSEVESLKGRLSDSENGLQLLRAQPLPGNQPVMNSQNTEPVQNPTPTTAKRCKAITASGSQCTRNAQEGSDYCWQHIKNYEAPKTSSSPGNINSSGSHEIQTGPRGGKYYINSSGKKTYIRKK
jgi:hypothetical protein